MEKQICSLFKDATEENNQINVFVFKKNKKRTKKCKFGLDLNPQGDKKI